MKSLFRRTGRKFPARSHHRRLLVEQLERRALLATFLVNSLDDAGGGELMTLREALESANATNAADVIRFDPNLFANSGEKATIHLVGGPLLASKPVVIYGPGADQLTIDGNENGAVFAVTAQDVVIAGLEITGGSEGGLVNFPSGELSLFDSIVRNNSTTYDASRGFEGGGGIHNAGSLTVRGVTISGNRARSGGVFPFGRGGGISSTFGSLDIQDSLIFGNAAEGDGGGIYLADDQDASIINVTVSDNTARLHGGGIAAFDGPVDLNHVTITGNQAADLGWEGRTGGGVFVGTDALTMTNTLIAGNVAGRDSTNTDQALRPSDVEYRTRFEYRDGQNDAPPEGTDLGPLALGDTRITGRMEGVIAPNTSSGDLHDEFWFTVPTGLRVADIHVSISGYLAPSQVFGDFRLDGDVLQHVTETGDTAHTLDMPLAAGIHKLDLRIEGAVFASRDVRIVYNITVTTEPVDAAQVESFGNLIGDPASAVWLINGVNDNIVGNGRGSIEPIDRILDVMLRDRGGPTRVHPLSLTSAAIDAGVEQGVSGPQTDQRGFPFQRSVRDSAPVKSRDGIPDIGAFEVQTTPLLLVESVSNATVWEFTGVATSGVVSLTIEGVDLSLFLPPGTKTSQVAEIVANAINRNSALVAMGINATADVLVSDDSVASGEKSILNTTGAITSYAVTDPGLASSLQRLDSGSAVLEVSTARDEFDNDFSAGDLSLREAVALANARPDHTIIRFSPNLSGIPVMVTAGELTLAWDTTIIGLGVRTTAVDAGTMNRLFNVAAASRVTITDLTLTNGRVTGGNIGGGAIVNYGDLTLKDVEARGNEASNTNGGAISNFGKLSIQESTLIANVSSQHGGGLYNHDGAEATIGPFVRATQNQAGSSGFGGGLYLQGTVTVIDSLIDQNNVRTSGTDHTAFFGGGIHIAGNAATHVQIVRSNINGNQAVVGGGISVDDAGALRVSIIDSTIDGNIARARNTLQALGGGVNVFLSNANSELTIIGTTISNNEADRGAAALAALGGGIHLSGAGNITTIANTTISGNSAEGAGGGIFVADHPASSGTEVPLEILNTTITHNDAQDGAGMFLDGKLFRLADSILVDNVHNRNNGDAPRDLFFQETATSDFAGNGSISDPSNNLINRYDIDRSTNERLLKRNERLDARNLVLDKGNAAALDTAGLGPLANNGGPTLTHKLRPGSAAIDAGSTLGWRRFNPTDQRGFPTTDSPGIANQPLQSLFFATGTDLGAFEAPRIEVRDWDSNTLNSAGGTSVSQFESSETADGTPGDPSAFGFGFLIPNDPSIPAEPLFLGFEWDPEPVSFGAIEEGFLGDEYGAEIRIDLDTKFGLEYGYYVDTGSVVADYEGLFRYTVDKNGDTFTIDTGNSIDVGALYTVSPRLGAFVDLVARFNADISGRVCGIWCASGSLPLRIDESQPLISINRQVTDSNGQPQTNDGQAVLDGDIRILGVSIDDFISQQLVEKFAEEIKIEQDKKRIAEIDKKQAERDLARETDPGKRATAQAKLNSANNRITAADETIKDKKKKKQNAADLCIGEIIQGCLKESDGGVLGIEASIQAGVGKDGIGSLSKPLGSLAVSVPEVQLSDTTFDDHSGKLSATTDDFVPGSEEDIQRQIAKLSVDVAGLFGPILGIPLGRYEASLGPITFDVTTLSYDVEPRLNVTQDISLQPFFDTNDELQSKSVNQHGVKFEFTDANGLPVQLSAKINGKSVRDQDASPDRVSELWFRPGSIVEIDTAGKDVTITPRVRLGHKFDNDVGLEIDIKGRLEALALQVRAFGETFIDIGPLIKHEHDLGTFDLGSVISEDDLLLSTSMNATEVIVLAADAADTQAVAQDGSQPGNAIDTQAGKPVSVTASANSRKYFSVPLTDESGRAFESVALRLVNGAGAGVADTTIQVPDGVTVIENNNGWALSKFGSGLGDEILIGLSFGSGAPAGTTFTATGALPVVVPTLVQKVTVERLEAVASNPQINQIAKDKDFRLDIDGDGRYLSSTDYVLLERFVLSKRDGLAFSIEHAVAPGAQRSLLAEISEHLDALENTGRLDVNADGTIDQDDLTLFARYFFGLTTQLPDGDDDGTRISDDAIAAFIAGEIKSPGIDEFTARIEAIAAESGLTVRRGDGDHFGMAQAFQIDASAVPGSSPWVPLAVDVLNGEHTFELTTFRTPVQYQDTIVEYTPEGGASQRLFVATGPVGAPPQLLADAAHIADLATARGDEFQEQLARTTIAMPTRSEVLGVRDFGSQNPPAAIFLMLPDSAGYVFTIDFPVTNLVFDPTAGTSSNSGVNPVFGNSALNHNRHVDGAEVDFDLFVPSTGEWFEISMDEPFAFSTETEITSFELYPRALPNAALHRIGNQARPEIEMTIGLVLQDISTGVTPTVTAKSVGPRELFVQPVPIESDGAASAEFRVQRDKSRVSVRHDGAIVALTGPDLSTIDPTDRIDVANHPASSLYKLQFSGAGKKNDRLVVDALQGPISVPITFDAGNDVDLGSGGFIEIDELVVQGAGVSIDITGQYELRGVERIDVRGSGANSLVLDEASVARNAPVDVFGVGQAELLVEADADDVVLGLDGWTLTTGQRDRYESPNGLSVVFLPRGTRTESADRSASLSFSAAHSPPALHQSIPASATSAPLTASAHELTSVPVARSFPVSSVSGPTQKVIATPASSYLEVNELLAVDLNYDVVNPSTSTPELLGLRVHYDSTMLELSGPITVQVEEGLVGSEDLPEQAADSDLKTDRTVIFGWVDTQNGWTPGLNELLAKLQFKARDRAGTTTIRLTGDTSLGYTFVGDPIRITISPKSFVVDRIEDSPSAGQTTLREAIEAANSNPGPDTVRFDESLTAAGPVTITITAGDLSITDSLVVRGPGADLLTLDAQGRSRIFDVGAGAGDVTIEGLTLTGGQSPAGESGGAVRSSTSGSLRVFETTIIGNAAGKDGGGIFSQGGLLLENSTVAGNTASNGGGGVAHRETAAEANIIASTFSGNSAMFGGAFMNLNASASIVNSTISGNSSTSLGGGIVSVADQAGNEAHLVVLHSTVTQNTTGAGGAIHSGTQRGATYAEIKIGHSLVVQQLAGDNVTQYDQANSSGAIVTSLGYNLVDGRSIELNATGDRTDITGFVVDPVLKDNGGPTKTHALLAGSPAIDAGDPAITVSTLPNDQRGAGFRRVLDGDGDGTAAVDVGALERAPGVIQLPVGETRVTNESGMILFRNNGNVLFQDARERISALAVQGGDGDETLAVGDLGLIDGQQITLRFDGRGGNDTLRLLGESQTIDLTTLIDGALQNVEVIDIRGSGVNTLILNLAEVLNIAPATGTLRVQHDEGDIVNLGAGWNVASPRIVDGQFVHILTQNSATVELVNTFAFQNPRLAVDANHDGIATPLDALVIINRLNRTGPSALPTPVSLESVTGFFYFDVNGDELVTPFDVLVIFNYLNSASSGGEGESVACRGDQDPLVTRNVASSVTAAGKVRRQVSTHAAVLGAPQPPGVLPKDERCSHNGSPNTSEATDDDLLAAIEAFFTNF